MWNRFGGKQFELVAVGTSHMLMKTRIGARNVYRRKIKNKNPTNSLYFCA